MFILISGQTDSCIGSSCVCDSMFAFGNSVMKSGLYVPVFSCALHFFPPVVLAQLFQDQGTDPSKKNKPGRNWLAPGLCSQGSCTTEMQHGGRNK